MNSFTKKWNSYLNEQSNRELYVFDFDDTIVRSTAPIVHVPSGQSLTSEEFETFKEMNPEVRSEDFDFSAFKEMVQGHTFDKTVDVILSAAERKAPIVILTARSDPAPVRDFMIDNFGLNIPVVAINDPQNISLADTDPQRKAAWIKSQIMSGYNKILYYEDSDQNIAAVQDLRNDEEIPRNAMISIYKVVGTPNNSKFLQKEVELYQRKVRTGHPKDKSDYLTHGGQDTEAGGGPYKGKMSMKRAKSAPPGAGGV